MPYRRPPRLSAACYVGEQRVFLTMCTFERAKYFADLTIGARVRDHIHALLAGRSEGADSRACADDFRRLSGFYVRRELRRRLWQDGYVDRVLRREEATLDVVRYVLLNPVRGGLCVEPSEYPLLGSSKYAVGELAGASGWGTLG